jgi:O-antigen/teichoic acid export membrane protein
MNTKWRKRVNWVILEGLTHTLKPLFTIAVSLLVIRWFAKAALWGTIVEYLVIAELAVALANWGLKPYLLKEFSLTPKNQSKLWYQAILARSGLLVMSLVLVVAIFSEKENLFVLLAIISVRWIIGLFDPLIQYSRKYILAFWSDTLGIVLAIIGLLYFKPLSLNITLNILLFSYLIRLLPLAPLIPKYVRNELFPVYTELKRSFPFWALGMAGLIQAKGDLYVVTYYLPKTDIAFYQVLIGFLILAQTGAAIIMGPFQKNIYRIKIHRITKLKQQYFALGILVTLLTSIAIFIAIKYIYGFNEEWYVMGMVFLYLIPLYAYLLESQFLLKANLEHKLLQYTISSGVVNLAFSFALVPVFGIYGALLSGIICRVVLVALVVNKFRILQKQA